MTNETKIAMFKWTEREYSSCNTAEDLHNAIHACWAYRAALIEVEKYSEVKFCCKADSYFFEKTLKRVFNK